MFGTDGVDGAPGLFALAAAAPEDATATVARYQAGFGWLARPDIVSLAAVQGHAVGAGFQLALACDIRIAADDAQFTMAETGLGLVPDLGGTKPLYELVGRSRAFDLCVTGRRVGGSPLRVHRHAIRARRRAPRRVARGS